MRLGPVVGDELAQRGRSVRPGPWGASLQRSQLVTQEQDLDVLAGEADLSNPSYPGFSVSFFEVAQLDPHLVYALLRCLDGVSQGAG